MTRTSRPALEGQVPGTRWCGDGRAVTVAIKTAAITHVNIEQGREAPTGSTENEEQPLSNQTIAY